LLLLQNNTQPKAFNLAFFYINFGYVKEGSILFKSPPLNELLSLFEQAHFIREDSEVSKQYTYLSDDRDIHFIASVLNEMIANPQEREEIEKEAEALRTIDALFGKTQRKQKRIIEEQEKILEEKDKALEEQARQIAELKRLLNIK
jgi:septal ring factor EnvC (AmiA/AmiB activator)